MWGGCEFVIGTPTKVYNSTLLSAQVFRVIGTPEILLK